MAIKRALRKQEEAFNVSRQTKVELENSGSCWWTNKMGRDLNPLQVEISSWEILSFLGEILALGDQRI